MAARVREELARLRLEVEEDEAGNLLARIPGRAERSVLLCAHLDTVPHGDASIEPVIVDDGWENANDAILGADNKAAVAVLLQVARRLAVEGSPVGIELLFTVREEVALAGRQGLRRVAAAQRLRLRPSITRRRSARSSWRRRRTSAWRRSSTAAPRTPGSGPRTGARRSSPRREPSPRCVSGRLDEQTTANIALDPRRRGRHERRAARGARSWARRARSATPPPRTSSRRWSTTATTRRTTRSASATSTSPSSGSSRATATRPARRRSSPPRRALRACGYEPRRILTGGGSDANALEAQGFPCTNLANGTERNHEPTERVSVAALDGMLDVVLALVDEVAAA